MGLCLVLPDAVSARSSDMASDMAAIITTPVLTVRRGELCALRRSDVDLEDGALKVRHSI